MENGTADYFGAGQTTHRTKAEAIAQENRAVHGQATQDKRPERDQGRHQKVRSAVDVANVFLNCKFLPKIDRLAEKVSQTDEKKEREFYCSLSKLSDFYGIVPMETRSLAFPYNIILAEWDVIRKLKEARKESIELEFVKNTNGIHHFISCETYSSNLTLYYIPVLPLYRLLRNRKRKGSAELLLSVFAYLYHVVAIPYFRQEDSYLYWQYQMISEWLEMDDPDNWETDDFNHNLSDLTTAKIVGDVIERKIWNRYNLEQFEKRIDDFTSKDKFEMKCLEVAGLAYNLYADYPETNIFRKVAGNEYDEDLIGMDRYISFIADTEGWTYDSIMQSVNDEFNNCSAFEEPTIKRVFGKKKVDKSDNLDFESRIFSMLDKLCGILYEI